MERLEVLSLNEMAPWWLDQTYGASNFITLVSILSRAKNLNSLSLEYAQLDSEQAARVLQNLRVSPSFSQIKTLKLNGWSFEAKQSYEAIAEFVATAPQLEQL